MRKWIYISAMIISLCFGLWFILGKKQSVPTKVLRPPSEESIREMRERERELRERN